MKRETAFSATLNEVVFGNAAPHSAAQSKSARPPVSGAMASADLAFGDLWRRARTWWTRMVRLKLRAPRRLRLCESLPLGERRFVAVVEFERSRFLLGGTSASLVLLATLPAQKAQDEVEGDTAPTNQPHGSSREPRP